MSNELSVKRCERCELIYANTPENFSLGSMNRDVLSAWCMECAREVREQRYLRRDDWEYSERKWAPRSGRLSTFPREAA